MLNLMLKIVFKIYYLDLLYFCRHLLFFTQSLVYIFLKTTGHLSNVYIIA